VAELTAAADMCRSGFQLATGASRTRCRRSSSFPEYLAVPRLTEVLALAAAGKIKHTITAVKFDGINDRLNALGRGDVVGRQVVVFG
jgi:hypothetical protein